MNELRINLYILPASHTALENMGRKHEDLKIGIDDFKRDLRSQFGYYGTKESRFTAVLAAILFGLIVSVLFPDTDPFLFLTIGVIGMLEFLHLRQRWGWLLWVLVLVSFSFFAASFEVPDGAVTRLPLRTLLVLVLLWGSLYCQFRLGFYKKLRELARWVLEEAESVDQSQQIDLVNAEKVVLSRYYRMFCDESSPHQTPSLQRVMTFILAGEPQVRDDDASFRSSIKALGGLRRIIPAINGAIEDGRDIDPEQNEA